MGPRGFGLLEIVLGAAIISLAFFALIGVTGSSVRYVDHALRENQATFLLEEGAEALRSLRDTSWGAISGLSTTTTYRLAFVTGTYPRFAATTSTAFIDQLFDRTIAVSDVYRDASDNIAPSGTYDPGTRKFKVNVSWREPSGTTTESVELYLSNI